MADLAVLKDTVFLILLGACWYFFLLPDTEQGYQPDLEQGGGC